MLVLGRRLGETIIINDNIKITVTSIKGSQVKLGIYAPKEIAVNREEIYNLIQAENKNKEESKDAMDK